MPVHIVRHGCAGDKSRWAGPDLDRPLDDVGRRQADVLADHLARTGARRIVSSPAARCLQTVEPLARRVGLRVEPEPAIRPDRDPKLLLALAAELEDDQGVLCTHGELMQPVLDELRRDGTPIRSARPDDGWLLGKGTVWLLTLDAGGAVTALDHHVPPGLPLCPHG